MWNFGGAPLRSNFQRVVDGLPRRTHSSQGCKFYKSWGPAFSIPCYSLPWIAPFCSSPIDFLDLDVSKIRIRVGWRIWLGPITHYLDGFCFSWWWSWVLLHLHSQPRGVISPSHNSELITYRPDKRGSLEQFGELTVTINREEMEPFVSFYSYFEA